MTYTIETNENTGSSLVYLNGELVKCFASSSNELTSVQKAENFIQLQKYLNKTFYGFSGGNYTSTIIRIWNGYSYGRIAIFADLQIGNRVQKMQVIGDSKGLFYTIN